MNFMNLYLIEKIFANNLVKKLCQYLIPFRSYKILKTFDLGKAHGRLATSVMSYLALSGNSFVFLWNMNWYFSLLMLFCQFCIPRPSLQIFPKSFLTTLEMLFDISEIHRNYAGMYWPCSRSLISCSRHF